MEIHKFDRILKQALKEFNCERIEEGYYSYAFSSPDEISLDGRYTILQLKALVKTMEHIKRAIDFSCRTFSSLDK